MPGAAELIGRAHAESWRVAVLTNGDEAQQRRKLSVIGLDNRCLRVFASSTLGFAKPAAQAFWAACEGLGRSPSECVMVGDDYANDVQAARAAGLTAIHVTRSPDERRPESAASLLDVRDRLFAPSRPPA